MENNSNSLRSDRHDRFWTGLVLVIIGGGLLARRMGVPLPEWLFTWPMIIILIGLVSGIKSRFESYSWIIITAIGCIFLSGEVIRDVNMEPYFWPIIIIGLGLLYMFRPKRNSFYRERCLRQRSSEKWASATVSEEDMINSISVFGGVKKVVTSKNFKGGEIVCFMGGSEINLSQADINGTVVIDITLVFGGTKLILPPHWDVRSESVAIFAGIEDKRPIQAGNFDPNKIIVLRGTTVFGGIEIKSY